MQTLKKKVLKEISYALVHAQFNCFNFCFYLLKYFCLAMTFEPKLLGRTDTFDKSSLLVYFRSVPIRGPFQICLII